MITKFIADDKNEVIELMDEAFGDSPDAVLKFLEKYQDDVFLYKEEGKVLGMFSLLKVSLKGKKGRYIYAVATKKEARGKGIATKLLDFAKDFVKKGEADFLVLVPSEESLFQFYEKRGFTGLTCAEKVCISGKKKPLKTEKITEKELFSARKRFYGDNLILWDSDDLCYAISIYKNALKITDEKGEAYALCYKEGDLLFVKELVTFEMNFDDALMYLNYHFDTKVANATIVEKGKKPYALSFPKDYCDAIFSIALD